MTLRRDIDNPIFIFRRPSKPPAPNLSFSLPPDITYFLPLIKDKEKLEEWMGGLDQAERESVETLNDEVLAEKLFNLSISKYIKKQEKEKFQAGVSDLLTDLKKWIKENWPNDSEKQKELIDGLDVFYNNNFLSVETINPNKVSALYIEGIPKLAEVVTRFRDENVSIEKKKATLLELVSAVRLCEVGANEAIHWACEELSTDLNAKLAKYRTNLAKDCLLAMLGKDLDYGNASETGMEKHYIQGILNHFADSLETEKISEKYVENVNYLAGMVNQLPHEFNKKMGVRYLIDGCIYEELQTQIHAELDAYMKVHPQTDKVLVAEGLLTQLNEILKKYGFTKPLKSMDAFFDMEEEDYGSYVFKMKENKTEIDWYIKNHLLDQMKYDLKPGVQREKKLDESESLIYYEGQTIDYAYILNESSKIKTPFLKYYLEINELKSPELIRNFWTGYSEKEKEAFLIMAAKDGQLKLMSDLLLSGVNPNVQDKNGLTPLHHAVESGHLNLVSTLLNLPNINFEISDNGSLTPLLLAIKEGKTDVAEALINKGANVNAVNFQNENSLHLAVAYGRSKIVDLLIRDNKIYYNQISHYKADPVLYALYYKNLELIKKFNELDMLPPGSLINCLCKPELPYSSLFSRLIRENKNVDLINYYLDTEVFDGVTGDPNAPLVENAQILLDLLLATEEDGVSPLAYMAYKHPDIFKKIINMKVFSNETFRSIFISGLDLSIESQYPPSLYLAVYNPSLLIDLIDKRLIEMDDVLKILSQANENGMTVIRSLAENDPKSLVRLLSCDLIGENYKEFFDILSKSGNDGLESPLAYLFTNKKKVISIFLTSPIFEKIEVCDAFSEAIKENQVLKENVMQAISKGLMKTSKDGFPFSFRCLALSEDKESHMFMNNLIKLKIFPESIEPELFCDLLSKTDLTGINMLMGMAINKFCTPSTISALFDSSYFDNEKVSTALSDAIKHKDKDGINFVHLLAENKPELVFQFLQVEFGYKNDNIANAFIEAMFSRDGKGITAISKLINSFPDLYTQFIYTKNKGLTDDNYHHLNFLKKNLSQLEYCDVLKKLIDHNMGLVNTGRFSVKDQPATDEKMKICVNLMNRLSAATLENPNLQKEWQSNIKTKIKNNLETIAAIRQERLHSQKNVDALKMNIKAAKKALNNALAVDFLMGEDLNYINVAINNATTLFQNLKNQLSDQVVAKIEKYLADIKEKRDVNVLKNALNNSLPEGIKINIISDKKNKEYKFELHLAPDKTEIYDSLVRIFDQLGIHLHWSIESNKLISFPYQKDAKDFVRLNNHDVSELKRKISEAIYRESVEMYIHGNLKNEQFKHVEARSYYKTAAALGNADAQKSIEEINDKVVPLKRGRSTLVRSPQKLTEGQGMNNSKGQGNDGKPLVIINERCESHPFEISENKSRSQIISKNSECRNKVGVSNDKSKSSQQENITVPALGKSRRGL